MSLSFSRFPSSDSLTLYYLLFFVFFASLGFERFYSSSCLLSSLSPLFLSFYLLGSFLCLSVYPSLRTCFHLKLFYLYLPLSLSLSLFLSLSISLSSPLFLFLFFSVYISVCLSISPFSFTFSLHLSLFYFLRLSQSINLC